MDGVTKMNEELKGLPKASVLFLQAEYARQEGQHDYADFLYELACRKNEEEKSLESQKARGL